MNYLTTIRTMATAAACLISSVAFGQTLQSIPFRANLSNNNEVPPTATAATGSATVWIHALRNSSGAVTEAVVDFNVDYSFPGPVTLTGLHVHRGIRGQNGPVVLDSGLKAGEPEDATGKAGIFRQSAKLNTAAAISAINDMIANPDNFYVNLHTTVSPGGAIRGQALATKTTVVMTELLPANEVPPTDTTGKGFAAVTLITGRDTTGAVVSSEATFDVSYTGFPAGTEFTGLHIHTGAAGVNGPVTINSALSGSVAAAANGTGTLKYTNRISAPNAATIAALAGVETNPAGYYINLHTKVNPGGAIRGQAVAPDSASFGVRMLPSNEVPPIEGLDAGGNANFTLRTLRGTTGTPTAALAIFDVYHAFPGEAAFTGLHVHTGVAGQNGPVVIDSGLKAADGVATTTGLGSIYRQQINSNASVLATALQNPAGHYINLHTAVNPGGAIRSQLTASSTALPVITTVSANSGGSSTVRTGTLIKINGTALASATAATTNPDGSGVPSLVGTSVKVGGQDALVRSVSPTEVVVETPRNVGLGGLPVATFPVLVTTPNGTSNVGNLILSISGN